MINKFGFYVFLGIGLAIFFLVPYRFFQLISGKLIRSTPISRFANIVAILGVSLLVILFLGWCLCFMFILLFIYIVIFDQSSLAGGYSFIPVGIVMAIFVFCYPMVELAMLPFTANPERETPESEKQSGSE